MKNAPLPQIIILALALLWSEKMLAADPPITQDELVRRTQELFDAVVPGDRAPWQKYFADDCMYHDEKGRTMDKAKLLADIAPMPKGYSGTIKIKNPESRIADDTAILSYDLDETETIFGQELHARYHETDTWLRRHGEWQIIAAQAFRYYEDPAVGKADPEKLPAYVGTYELSKQSDRKTTVTIDNNNLFMQRTGGKKVQLFPEAEQIFFRKGVEGRILFHHDATGKIDTLIDRRNNEDVIWRKTA